MITADFSTVICRAERKTRNETVTAGYNVFSCYDSQNCKPKFYDGHLLEDFDYMPAEPNDGTLDGYIKYLRDMDDELPDGFYMRRKTT